MSVIEVDAYDVAAQLIQARKEVAAVSELPLPNQYPLELAYQVQKSWIRQYQGRGNRVSGWKVAMANQAAMDRFKLAEPVYGVLFKDMLLEEAVLDSKQVIAPKLEVELAFILGCDLEGESHTDADIIDAISHIAPAFEIADSRIKNWQFNIASFVADNAVASAYQLGQLIQYKTSMPLDDFDCRLSFSTEGDMSAEENAEESKTQSTDEIGSVYNVLGGPLSSFINTVRAVLKQHGRVEAGQHFLSGSLTKPIDMVPGTTYTVQMFNESLTLSFR